MIIFLYGPDDYRRAEKKKYWIAEFGKKHSSLTIRGFDLADENQLDEFKGFARGQSIFEDRKLAILENIYEADEDALGEVLKRLLADRATTVLISERAKPNKALDFLLNLKKPEITEKFDYLKERDLRSFIARAAREMNVNLSDSAAAFLAEVYKDGVWGLMTELGKIRDFPAGGRSSSGGKSGAIERVDLENLGLEVAPDFWLTMNGLKNPDIAKRLTTLEKIFSRNEPPPKIFNILASMWREKIPQMAEYDLKVKSGKMDYEEALLDLVL